MHGGVADNAPHESAARRCLSSGSDDLD
jgi:hypothetical protein